MIRKRRKSTKYVFSLTGVNIDKIDDKYGIKLIANLSNDGIPNNTTKLTDINLDKPVEVISFLDESKRLYQCSISIIDFKTGNELEKLKYNCFWCRHQFSSYPIGCPIKYVSNKATKKYHSEVTKDTYVIKENITSEKSSRLKDPKYTPFVFYLIKDKNPDNEYIINKEEYYISDGVFCSFNCCKSFIKDNTHNSLYQHSEILLTKLFNASSNDMFSALASSSAIFLY